MRLAALLKELVINCESLSVQPLSFSLEISIL